MVLKLQLVANEVYEHDIMSIQARLRRKIKWFSMIMEFQLNACKVNILKIVPDDKPYIACDF